MSSLKHSKRAARDSKRIIIDPNISEEQIVQILMSDSFPQTSFIDLACQINMTASQSLLHSEFEQAKKLKKQLKQLSDSQELMNHIRSIRQDKKKAVQSSHKGIKFIYDDICIKRKFEALSLKCKQILPKLICKGY